MIYFVVNTENGKGVFTNTTLKELKKQENIIAFKHSNKTKCVKETHAVQYEQWFKLSFRELIMVNNSF